jgi:hypothetical protein
MTAGPVVLGDLKCIIPVNKDLLPIWSMAADPIATRDWNPLRPDDSADAEVMLALLVFRWH